MEVVNARHSSSHRLWVDLGPVVAKQQCSAKVTLYNSGLRAAFVKILCYPLKESEATSPLPVSRASVSPAECVLHPQQMQEVAVTYRPSQSEETKCSELSSPLARLVVLSGDEIVRQRFQRAAAERRAGEDDSEEGATVGSGGKGGGRRERGRKLELVNKLNEAFLKRFPGQESVPSELDFSSFEVEDEEQFFEQHIQQVTITLSGRPTTESPIPKQRREPLSTSFGSPPKALHTLSPSHSTTQATPTSHTHPATPSTRITSSHTLILPDTVIGQYSGDIHVYNMYTYTNEHVHPA